MLYGLSVTGRFIGRLNLDDSLQFCLSHLSAPAFHDLLMTSSTKHFLRGYVNM
jgi:hypothetical protein